MTKPKKTQSKDNKNAQQRDLFYTPDYATDLIVPFLCGKLWECASGEGHMVRRLRHHGFDVTGTELREGFNFLADKPFFDFDMIVTNPPFSLKEEFYNQCLRYEKPFALLVPVDVCQWNLRAVNNDGAQWLIPTRRIDYITPTGKRGKQSNAQFHSGYLTVGLNLPNRFTVVELELGIKQGNSFLPMFQDADN